MQGPAGPLKGLVVAVSKKLSGQQSDMNNMAAELGADYRWTYDETCTHFVYQVPSAHRCQVWPAGVQ